MKALKKYLITFGIGLLAVMLIISTKGIFTAKDTAEIFKILCDSTFAVGFTMAGMGLLVYTSNEGVFDGLIFGVSSFINMFRKGHKKKYKDLYEYKESKANKKYGFGYIVICGLIFLVVSLAIMLPLYNKFS